MSTPPKELPAPLLTAKPKNLRDIILREGLTPDYYSDDFSDNWAEIQYAKDMIGDGNGNDGALKDLTDYATTTSTSKVLKENQDSNAATLDKISEAIGSIDTNAESLQNPYTSWQNDQITRDVKNTAGGFVNSSTTDSRIANAVANNTANNFNQAVSNAQANAQQTISNIGDQSKIDQSLFDTQKEPLDDLTAYGTDMADTMYNAETGLKQSEINKMMADANQKGTDWTDYLGIAGDAAKIAGNVIGLFI